MTDTIFTALVVASMFCLAVFAVLAINATHIAAWFAFKAYDLRAWLRGIPDRICIWLAWRVLPKRLVMWCMFRVGAWATTGAYSKQNACDLTFMEAAKRWETA